MCLEAGNSRSSWRRRRVLNPNRLLISCAADNRTDKEDALKFARLPTGRPGSPVPPRFRPSPPLP
ncbi:MAG: hypothetical protein LBO04_08645 [Spirochaetaceae bacterium]|nr:hypothetical protein [Spirochaetaceae bacterium]